MIILNTEYNGFVLFILGVILLIMLYFLYYYNFSARVYQQTAILDYPSKISVSSMPICSSISNPAEQYIVSDYYIASSANSTCVGNLKYDYVSTEMIAKVLQSGARYIEIPVCQSTVSAGSAPVVATGELVGNWITSLNTLSAIEVFNVIKSNAFKTINGTVNYPLFINLKLYTTDTGTLNQLASTLSLVFKGLLIDTTPYRSVPITMERVCVLLGRIILLSSDDYSQSNLVSIICPSSGYLKRINNTKVSSFNIPTTDPNYPKVLSKTQQANSDAYFNTKYPTLRSVVGKADFLGELQSDKKILDVLTNFNKVGVSVIYPNEENETYITNYDPQNAWDYGCTFVALNYQLYDANMTAYINKFSTSSFVLKPAGFRFSRIQNPVIDINAMVPDFNNKAIPIINDFVAKYGEQLIAIGTYVAGNYYISTSSGNGYLKTQLIGGMGGFSLDNTFVFVKSANPRLSGAIMIQSATNPTMYITLDGSNFYLKAIDLGNSNAVSYGSFYPVAPQCGDVDYFSLRCVISADVGIPQYLGISASSVIAINQDPKASIKASVCFQATIVPSYKTAIIANLQSLYLYTDDDGTLLMGESSAPMNTPDMNFQLNLTAGRSLSDPNSMVNIVSLRNNKFLLVQYDNKLIANGDIGTIPTAQFKIFTIGGGIYMIQDYMKRFLISDNQNLISFMPDSPLVQMEKKDARGNIVQPALYGASLGTTKYFKVYLKYNVAGSDSPWNVVDSEGSE